MDVKLRKLDESKINIPKEPLGPYQLTFTDNLDFQNKYIPFAGVTHSNPNTVKASPRNCLIL